MLNPKTILICYLMICIISGAAATMIHYDMAEASRDFAAAGHTPTEIHSEIREEIMEFAATMTEIMRLCFGAFLGALSMAWQQSIDARKEPTIVEVTKESTDA